MEFAGLDFEKVNDLMVFQNKLVLPKALYSIKIAQEHLISAHARVYKIGDIIRQNYHIVYPKDFKKLLKAILDACIACTVHLLHPNRYKAGIFRPEYKGQVVSLDFIEGLPGANPYLLVFYDTYTKFISAYPLGTKAGINVVRCLANYVASHGPISCLLGDSAFKFNRIKSFSKENGIHLANSSAYHSTSRAHVESANRRIQLALKTQLLANNAHYENALPLCIYLLNNKNFINTQISPAMMHLGVQLNDWAGEMRPEIATLKNRFLSTQDVKQYMEELRDNEVAFQVERQILHQNLQAKRNIGRVPHDFKVGELVLVKREAVLEGASSKLLYKYNPSPYRIRYAKDHILFLVSLTTGIEVARSPSSCKRVGGINFNSYLGYFEGDMEVLANLLGVFTESKWTQELEELINYPKPGTQDKTGVITRARAQQAELDKDDYERLLMEYLEHDDELEMGKGVTFEY